jgi:cysteinyl-tRNA synthetase
MRSFVFADILNNTLSALYPESEITHVINITDVGHLVGDGNDGVDKMEKGSLRTGKSVWDISKYYTEDFLKCLNDLNVGDNEYVKSKVKDGEVYSVENYKKEKLISDKYTFTRATDYIQEQINLIKKLEDKGYTYKTSDGIYFDTSKYADYAKFAKLNVEGMEKGIRVEDEKDEKKNKTDFALWKFSPQNETRQMEWESPWGVGFPGWHIECSAMSEAVLGKHFDIHTGGIDHIPVHHSNEIAQSVCAHSGENTENQFVNYWMHNNFLNDVSGKMSKSNDEFLRLQTLVDKKYNPSAYRYLLLTTNYRKELEFSYDSLDAASNALKKLQKYMHEAAKNTDNIIDATKYRINDEWYEKFLLAMCDDLNTSKALAVVWELINLEKENNRIKEGEGKNENKNKSNSLHVYSTILKMNKVLGLDLSFSKDVDELSYEDQEIVDDLFAKRKAARESKDWATSDTLREQIKAFGVEVVD